MLKIFTFSFLNICIGANTLKIWRSAQWHWPSKKTAKFEKLIKKVKLSFIFPFYPYSDQCGKTDWLVSLSMNLPYGAITFTITTLFIITLCIMTQCITIKNKPPNHLVSFCWMAFFIPTFNGIMRNVIVLSVAGLKVVAPSLLVYHRWYLQKLIFSVITNPSDLGPLLQDFLQP